MEKIEFLQKFQLFSSPNTKNSININHRQSAVLIPVVEQEKSLHLLLTRRASHLKHHPNQICFPGGKVENSDENEIATAIREAHEEVGIEPNKINVLGQLASYNTLSYFTIQPVLSFVDIADVNQLIIDENEVAEVFLLPLSHVINKNNYQTEQYYFQGKKRQVTFLPYQHYNIWGATAAILLNLSKHLNE